MNRSSDLNRIKRLVKNGATHEQPKVDLLLGELRSDYGLPSPPPTTGIGDAVVIVWEYDICLGDFDAFHGFLLKTEPTLAADVQDLDIGASYGGTFAQLPQGNPHRTYWAYSSVKAVDKFKDALAKQKKSELYKNFSRLVAFINCCCTLRMHRYYRASLLANHIATQRAADPILDLFAGKANKKI